MQYRIQCAVFKCAMCIVPLSFSQTPPLPNVISLRHDPNLMQMMRVLRRIK